MKYFLVAIALLVLFTACASKTPVRNDGLVINSFTIDPDEVESYTGKFTASLEVQNMGGTTAKNSVAYLLGASWLGDQVISYDLQTLQPYDIRTGAPGETKIAIWNIPQVAQLPEGVSQDYKLTTRVDYDYSTTAVANIPVVNEDEYMRMKQKGEQLDPVSISNTNAPIVVEVNGQPLFIRKSPPDPQEKFFFRLFFVNTGSGVPFADQGGTRVNGLIGGTIKVEGRGVSFDDCAGTTGGDTIDLSTASVPVIVRKGESALVPCSISVDPSQWASTPKGTISLIFDLKYRYFIDYDSSIRVLGRRPPA